MVLEVDRYHSVLRRIESAAARFGRDRASVKLLAVSKRQPVSAIQTVAGYGQQLFAENYIAEAEAKIAATQSLPLEWHFIGRIQSNKTRRIAALFDWVHGIDRIKVAERLNDQRAEFAKPLNICVEVNVSGEVAKAGIRPDEVADFVNAVRKLSNLRVRGLMALPAPVAGFDKQRESFSSLRNLLVGLDDPDLDTLSMGTSDDFEAAIAEGATIVRIGTALFGSRN